MAQNNKPQGTVEPEGKQNGHSGWASRFVSHAVTVALAGTVAWAVTTYIDWRKANTEEQKLTLELERDKVAILTFVKERDTELALILIDYYDEKFGRQDLVYGNFLKAVADYISSAPGLIASPTPARSTT